MRLRFLNRGHAGARVSYARHAGGLGAGVACASIIVAASTP